MAKVVLPRSLQRLLVHLFVGLFRGNYFFVHGGQEEKKGEWEGTGWGLDLWVELCTPPKYWHSTSPVVETKVLHPTLQTLTFQPGCFIARPTVVCTRSCPDYWELFGFPLVDGFSSKKGCEWQRCLSFRWWQQSLFLVLFICPSF